MQPDAPPPTHEQLLDEIDLRTDRTRRSLLPSLGNALMFSAFFVLPTLPGGAALFGAFGLRHALLLSGPLIACIIIGAALHRTVGPHHALYRTLDALEMCLCVGYAAWLPLIEPATSLIAGVFLVISSAFWGLAKPGRRRLYGGLIAMVSSLPVAVLAVEARFDRAAFAAVVGIAASLAYVMCVRARQEGVRAESRRNRLREDARALRITQERERISRELSDHVFSQLDMLASALAHLRLPEAATARRLSEMASELVLPASQAIELDELSELLQRRCRALCRGIRLSFRAFANGPPPQFAAASARAVMRVAQELVRNSVVHGGAATIDVTLEVSGERARLTVSDDGIGLSTEVAQHASGGLLNARGWVEACGGSIEFTQHPGFRTCIVVSVQVQQPRQSQHEQPTVPDFSP